MKSLTDVVSGAGLSGYAEIALLIFFVAFIGVVLSLFVPSRQRTYEHLRQLPMDSDELTLRSEPSPGTTKVLRFAQDDSNA
jgi:cbb3-type cytochrome oxidase subunit 3